MQQPQTFPLLRGKGAQAGGERAQARARGRGPRPARSPGGCTARAPTRVGPGSGARGVESGGLLLPCWRLRGGHGTPGGSAPLRLASAPRVRSRGSAGTRSRQVAGRWGLRDREAGRPGRKAVGGAGRTEVLGGLLGRVRAGGEMGACGACSLAEMSAWLRPALPGRLGYLPRVTAHPGGFPHAGLFRFSLSSPSDLDL